MEALKNNKKNRLEFKYLKDLVLLKINGKIFSRRLINYSISSDIDTYNQEDSIIADFTLDVENVKDLRKEKGILILDDTEIYDVVEFYVLKHIGNYITVTFKIKVDLDNIIIHFNRSKSGMLEEWRSKEELLEQNFRQLSDKLTKAYERNDIDRIERLFPMLLNTYSILENTY